MRRLVRRYGALSTEKSLLRYRPCLTPSIQTWVRYLRSAPTFTSYSRISKLYEGWFSRTIGYGLVYGHAEFVTPLETSYTLVAALIAGDTPQQIDWHLEGAQRSGATFEEVNAVREASIKVAELSGIQWRHPIPEVKRITGRPADTM